MNEPSQPELSLVADPVAADARDARAAMARIHGQLFGEELDPVRLGRYRIIRRIARGSFGSVYTAFDPRLDRKVALKVIADGGDAVADRMLVEARALARVAHPNVVTVFDAERLDSDEGPVLVMAMEFVDGVSVRDWAAGGRAPTEVLRVFRDAADGLALAHHQGLVHLDIKPSNLLVDATGRPRVIDFGLARPVGEQGIRGTPATMAPEQHTGALTDARTDVYGLAATCWWTLFGDPPFAGTAPEELLAAKRDTVPRASRRGVPGWVVKQLVRAMAPDPTMRPTTMRELRSGLLPRWRRRGFVGVAAAALVATTASAATYALGDRADRIRSFVDEHTAEARQAASRAYFVYPPSHDPAQRSAYMSVISLEAHGSDDAGTRALELRREFAETLVRLGDRYWDVPGGRPFAIDYYILATAFAEHPRAAERAFITAGELSSLRSRARDGRFTPGELEAADTLIALADPDPERRLLALRGLAVEGRDRPASRRHDREQLAKHVGVELAPTAVEDPPAPVSSAPAPEPTVASPPPRAEPPPLKARPSRAQGVARVLETAADAYDRGDWSLAFRAYNEALEEDPRNLDATLGLSDVEYQRGRYAAALRWAEQAAVRAPKRAGVFLRIGDAARKTMQYERAREAYARAVQLGSEPAEARLLRLKATQPTP